MFKLIHQNMVMAEAVPFGQRWTYYSTHPIEELINPEYFKSSSVLRSGDDLRVIQLEGVGDSAKVIAYADILIVGVKPLLFEFTRNVKQVVAKRKSVEIRQGVNCWELYEGEDLIDKFPSKGRAEQARKAYEDKDKVA